MNADVVDPRVARTRRDVVDTTAGLLLTSGWDAVTHAEVARLAGYSKATLYTHWPTRLDLIAAAIDQICDADHHSAPTGDLRADLNAALIDFAHDLTEGHLDRLLAGVVERSTSSEVVRRLRTRLYETGTSGLRGVLEMHVVSGDVDAVLALLTGAVLVRVTFDGRPATPEFVGNVVERVLGSATLLDS